MVLGEIALTGARFGAQPERNLLFWDELLAGVRADPTIASAGLANWVPLGTGGTSFIDLPTADRVRGGAGYRVIGDGYLETLGVPLLSGRTLEAGDGPNAPRVARHGERAERRATAVAHGGGCGGRRAAWRVHPGAGAGDLRAVAPRCRSGRRRSRWWRAGASPRPMRRVRCASRCGGWMRAFRRRSSRCSGGRTDRSRSAGS